MATRSDRLTPLCAFECSVLRLPDALASPAVGVGHESLAKSVEPPSSSSGSPREAEPAGPSMRCAHVARSKTVPLRIEPEYGKGSEDGIASVNSDAWDVLQEHEVGSYFAQDALEVRPQPALVFGAEATPRLTERLAREARRNEIHNTTPAFALEGREIVPDRRWIQSLVFHPRHESGRGESVEFDVTHAVVVSAGKGETEFETS